MKKQRLLRNYHQILGIFFVLFVTALLLLIVLLPDRSYSETEKRSLSSFPKLSLQTVKDASFMDGIETYLADQFPLRDELMKIKASLDLLLLKTESQDVYYGTDGFLMEKFTDMPAAEAEETQAAISDFLSRYPDMKAFFLLSPTAVSVYSELLPAYATTDDQNAFIDEWFSSLDESVTAVDVRPVFSEKKNETDLFYHTDHHWTDDGARLAASELLQAMGIEETTVLTSGVVTNRFSGSLVSKSGFPVSSLDSIRLPKLSQSKENGFFYTVTYNSEKVMKASLYDYQAVNGSDPYQVFFGSNHPEITIETSADTSRKLLIFKDSYANSLIPYLLPYFKEIRVIDPRYYYDDIDLLIQENRYDSVVFLYNATTFATDVYLADVLNNIQ